jgi:hypothetical protein
MPINIDHIAIEKGGVEKTTPVLFHSRTLVADMGSHPDASAALAVDSKGRGRRDIAETSIGDNIKPMEAK